MAASWPSSLAVSFFSRSASFLASSWGALNICRMRTKARTTKTLICIARGLRSMFAAMIAPCSVKAKGRYPRFWLQGIA